MFCYTNNINLLINDFFMIMMFMVMFLLNSFLIIKFCKLQFMDLNLNKTFDKFSMKWN